MYRLLKIIYWSWQTLYLDLRYGGMLKGVIPIRHAQSGAYDTVNSPYSILPHLFAGRIHEADVLVDVGCGRGRVINWWLSRGYRNQIIGIELDAAVAAATRQRLQRFANVTILSGDAIELLPVAGTVFYFYNPFNAAVMRRFKDRLFELFSKNRNVTLFYWNPEHLDVFETDPRWQIETVQYTDLGDPRLEAKHRRGAIIRLRDQIDR